MFNRKNGDLTCNKCKVKKDSKNSQGIRGINRFYLLHFCRQCLPETLAEEDVRLSIEADKKYHDGKYGQMSDEEYYTDIVQYEVDSQLAED